MKHMAGSWLAQHTLEQLQQVSDPTKLKLDVRLSFLKPHFTRWLAEAHSQMAANPGLIESGWMQSGMGEAFKLAKGFSKDTAMYKEAKKLNDAGMLFEKFTSKRNADLAEKVLASNFADLLEDDPDLDHADGDDGETWQAQEYASMFGMLAQQGEANERMLEKKRHIRLEPPTDKNSKKCKAQKAAKFAEAIACGPGNVAAMEAEAAQKEAVEKAKKEAEVAAKVAEKEAQVAAANAAKAMKAAEKEARAAAKAAEKEAKEAEMAEKAAQREAQIAAKAAKREAQLAAKAIEKEARIAAQAIKAAEKEARVAAKAAEKEAKEAKAAEKAAQKQVLSNDKLKAANASAKPPPMLTSSRGRTLKRKQIN